jgi:diguanylate cyclase (GGDEF)-like protein
MTTRPIELGLTRNADGQSPTKWQIEVVSTILAGFGSWSADPDSPRTVDFVTRVDRLRKTLVPGMSSHELADAVERVLQLCDTFFEDTRTILGEREKELTSVVQVLRETLADLAGQAKAFNVDLMRSTDRIGTLSNVDDIRELKRMIASEARELKHAVVEKQRRDDVLFTQMSKRVDALQTQLAEAQKQAEIDPLTEIANRRGFDRALKEWSLLAGKSRQPFSVAMVDLDDFKRINDTYGHQVGDRVLLCVAQRLVEDAGEGNFVARVGGEEFAVLFRGLTMDSAIERMAATLKRVAGLDYVFTVEGVEQRLRFTCSAGISEFQAGENPEDAVKRADRALYEAKRGGKNKAVGRKKGIFTFLPWGSKPAAAS